MRISTLACALAVGLTGIAATPAAALATPGASPSAPAPSMTSHIDMNMNMPMTSDAKPAPGRDEGTRRARQRAQFFVSTLSGKNEVPVAGGPAVGDPNASAQAVARVQGNRVTFAFTWNGMQAPTLGHIHQGVRGTNGDVKVPLFTTAMPVTVTAAAGNVTLDDATIADAIRDDPQGFYFNLHTKQFPGGAVRGQLAKVNTRSDVLRLVGGGPLEAFMSGDQEVPTPGGKAVGDQDGRAVAFVKAHTDGRVDYAFAWAGIGTPTLGHIHQGNAGFNGDVKVPLFTTAVPAGIIAIAGTVTGVDQTLVTAIAKKPVGFYANLHTAEFPGGAVRGQLFPRG
jgi:hypothetical protein